MLGLPRNVLVWDGEQLVAWLDALGLGEVAPAFLAHNVNGGTVRSAVAAAAAARQYRPCNVQPSSPTTSTEARYMWYSWSA